MVNICIKEIKPAGMRSVRTCTLRRAFAAAALLGLSCGAAQAQYITIDDPLAISTIAQGISGSNIVGYYSDNTGTHGFEYNGSTYTTINFPSNDTSKTQVFGISGNTMVGEWAGAGNITHGFVYDGSTFTSLDDPLTTSVTVATGISGNNIVGYYYKDTVFHGFIYNGSTYTTLDDPLSDGTTEALGIDGSNIVGNYSVGANEYGFLFNGTTYTTIGAALPGQSESEGISGGNIVGVNSDAGYVYNGSTYSAFDIPLSNFTELHGIDGESVVGSFQFTGGNVQGFEASLLPPAPTPEPGGLALLTGLSIASVVLLMKRRAIRVRFHVYSYPATK